MKTKLGLKLIVVLVTVSLYFLVVFYINNDINERIKTLTTQQVESLQTHYDLTTKYFKITANATYDFINSNKEVMKILTELPSAIGTQRDILQKKLYTELEPHYKKLQKQGVLQFHFLSADNITTLRMHKPSKHDDNLTNLKFSFRYVNENKIPISGFEGGRTSPSFRNVSPLFSDNGVHIGAVDVAYAPEILQKNLQEINKINSHFIIKKELFKDKKWSRNDNQYEYRNSIENEYYFESASFHLEIDTSLNAFIEPMRDEIADKMSTNKAFSLVGSDNHTHKIITFLPIKDMENKVVAFLISYKDSAAIDKLYEDFYIINIVIFLGFTLISFFVYRSIIYNRELLYEKKRFYHLSQYDTLTQLPNRALFYERVNKSISKATRDDSKFALMFLDIDNFKHINDSYGHDEGDRLLLVVSNKIKNVLRREDILARLGGDEFVIIIEDIDNAIDVLTITNHILDTMRQAIKIKNNTHYISASIGISIFPDDSKNPNNLLKFADVAMYEAKATGKNSAQFYSSEMTKELVARISLESELREAIQKDEFVVVYQPQIDASSEKIIGMEALVRWQHPTKGLLSPIEFIPIAEDTGLIIPLDQLVMKKATKQLSQWYEKGLNPGVLAMNLAMKQLQQVNFIQILSLILQESECKPEWIELEVTEGQIMKNPEEAIEILRQINDLNIELAIDDFGTGYSSLSYLKRLPIDKLKIDKSFVNGLPDGEEDIAIAKAVIALTQSLNIKVIAEGVETKEQKDFLLENGCKNIQGYFYSKPIFADEMEQYLIKKM